MAVVVVAAIFGVVVERAMIEVGVAVAVVIVVVAAVVLVARGDVRCTQPGREGVVVVFAMVGALGASALVLASTASCSRRAHTAS
jgi:hypothetical protein